VTAIPTRLQPSTFAVLADLLFTDGTLERQERSVLVELGSDVRLTAETVRQLLDIIVLPHHL
jgi:hypothetical protein